MPHTTAGLKRQWAAFWPPILTICPGSAYDPALSSVLISAKEPANSVPFATTGAEALQSFAVKTHYKTDPRL